MRYSYFSFQPLEISPKTLIYKFRSVRCDRVSGFVSICLHHVSEDIDVDLVDGIKPNFLYHISCPIGICLSEIQWKFQKIQRIYYHQILFRFKVLKWMLWQRWSCRMDCRGPNRTFDTLSLYWHTVILSYVIYHMSYMQ